MKHSLFFAAIALLLCSCSSSLRYPYGAPLSNDLFTAKSGVFSAPVPQGWFTSADTAVAQSLEAWLLREDFEATIVFRELHLDEQSRAIVEEDGLESLAHFSRAFLSSDSLQEAQPVEEFELDSGEFCSYEIKYGMKLKRIVVFSLNNRFFECEATAPSGNGSQPQPAEQIFTIQQSILASLKTVPPLP